MEIQWLTAFIDRPAASFDPATAFWLTVTASTLSSRRGPAGQFATLLPADGDGYLRVQRVDSGSGGSHLDLHCGDVKGLARRAERLGAVVLGRNDDLVVLRSPAGFQHCSVCDTGERVRPRPVAGRSGRTQVDQLCIDIPPGGFEREVAYWQTLTGWPLTPTGGAEFVRLAVPDALPLRLLLQRLDEPGQGVASAHLDLATDDADSAAAEHEVLGARIRAPFPGWIQLEDPAGLPYCLTRRPPWEHSRGVSR